MTVVHCDTVWVATRVGNSDENDCQKWVAVLRKDFKFISNQE